MSSFSLVQYEMTRLVVENTPTGVLVATITDVPAVRDISWQEGSEYITITTDDKVNSGCDAIVKVLLSQVLLYPLETCSMVTSCEKCTGSFPLCGWCTVENKCSRSFQCQNSSDTERWVTTTDQCIITIVTPRQFTLAAPSIVR